MIKLMIVKQNMINVYMIINKYVDDVRLMIGDDR